jgi:hypothetical protein
MQFSLTSDPWFDRGQILLIDMLERCNVIDLKRVEDNQHIFFELKSTDEMHQTRVLDELKFLCNGLVQDPLIVKIAGRSAVEIGDDGFANPKQMVQVRASDIEFVSDKAKQNELDGHKGDVRLLGAIAKNAKSGEVQADLARQYVGLRNDLKKVQSDLSESVTTFFRELAEPKGSTHCQVCGRATTKPAKMSQSRNPFYNQHHNTRVRGFASNAVPGVMCHVCNLINIVSSITETIPYYINDSTTTVLLPNVNNILVLRGMIRNMERPSVLIKGSDANVYSRSTNIKNSRSTNFKDSYLALLTICFNVLNAWNPNKLSSEELSKKIDLRSIKGWTVAPFAKGQNVNFKTFHYVPTTEQLFYSLLDIEGVSGEKHNIYADIFQKLNEDWVIHAAKALVEGNRRNMTLAIVEWHRAFVDEGRTFQYAEYGAWKTMLLWLPQFLKGGKEMPTDKLSPELSEDLKALGYQLGTSFASDVSYMTKLATVRGVREFQSLINHGLNIVYKMAYAKYKQQDAKLNIQDNSAKIDEDTYESIDTEDSGLRYSPRRLERVLHEVTDQNVVEAANVLGSFASLYAIIRLQSGSRRKKEDK